MEENSRLDSISRNFRQYLEARWNLFVLKSSDKAAGIAGMAATILVIGAFMLLVLIFLSAGAAIWIGNQLGDYSAGFLYIGLLYLVITILLILFRRALIQVPVINSMIAAFFEEDEEEEEDL